MRTQVHSEEQPNPLVSSNLVGFKAPLVKAIARILDGSKEKVFDMSSRPIKRLIKVLFSGELPSDPRAIEDDTDEQNKQILENVCSRAEKITLQPGKLTFKEALGRPIAALYFSEDGTVQDVNLFSSNGGESSANIPYGSPTAAAILQRAVGNIKSFGTEVESLDNLES